jgi:hypothetical protein
LLPTYATGGETSRNWIECCSWVLWDCRADDVNNLFDAENTMTPETTYLSSVSRLRIVQRFAPVALIALLAMLVLPVEPSVADNGLTGAWSGSGSVLLPSGASEKARCKATFRKRGTTSFVMDAVCASSSTRAAQTANLQQVGPNRFAGEFNNSEFNVSGSISVTLNGNSLSASLNGGGAKANFNLSR